ncbi:MAG: HAMP domain-containing sensor histidine kinase [Chthoniobacteraceae bacterium]
MQFTHSDFQDQLVRGLAHRMNNILTLFHGYLGLVLENQTLDQSTQDGLARIKHGAAQASELIDRTQALVRPSAIVWRTIDLTEFLRFLRPGFDHLRGPRTTIDLVIADDTPQIQGDASRIKMAMLELVKNACEATFSTGGHVRIELRGEAKADAHPQWAVFSVTDDGPGIPGECHEKVFAPFFSMKKKQNAAGLGLTLAASFAELHKGRISLQSAPGRTVFELRLPAAT